MAIIPCGSTWVARWGIQPQCVARSSMPNTLSPMCNSIKIRALAAPCSTLFSQESTHALFNSGSSTRLFRRRRGLLIVRADRDYYTVLSVSKSASKSDIKSAYRKLARSYHPDVNKESGAEANFKEISNAYEVLSDDEKRSIYDRYGEAGLKGAGAGSGDFSKPFDLFDLLFDNMGGMGMGGRGSRSRANEAPAMDLVQSRGVRQQSVVHVVDKEKLWHLQGLHLALFRRF